MTNLVYFIIVTLLIFCPQGVNCSHNCSRHCDPVPHSSPCSKISGECLEGCARGFFGTTCNNICNKNCRKKICAEHNGHCTKGCEANFIGDQCERNCSPRNETSYTVTERDGNNTTNHSSKGYFHGINVGIGIGIALSLGVGISIAVTVKVVTDIFQRCRNLISLILPIVLATERCPNCLDGECQESGQCIKGCIVGFADKYCQHKCQSTCKDANCQLDENTGKMICLSGCKDGFCGTRCKIPCDDGCTNCDYSNCACPRCSGYICQHSCLDGCSLCDKGQCRFCRDGLHGINCNQTCGTKCIRCKQKTGKCIKCDQGFLGDKCLKISTGGCNTTCAVLIVFLVIAILGIVFLIVHRRGWCQAFGRCRESISNAFGRCCQ